MVALALHVAAAAAAAAAAAHHILEANSRGSVAAEA